jgi:bilirubin oxidase
MKTSKRCATSIIVFRKPLDVTRISGLRLFAFMAQVMHACISMAQNPVSIPASISGDSITLNLQNGSKSFINGFTTSTNGFNGDFLGPTLILKKGQAADFTVLNSLSDTTTVHWHGLHVSPHNDGGPHNFILPGAEWKPSFTVLDEAGTYWYHPHMHRKTNEQVMRGAAGMIIVRDTTEISLPLPVRYGTDEFPVIIQTRHFDATGNIMTGTHHDSTVMVNGTMHPQLTIPAQTVRLRILNASSERVFNLGLDQGSKLVLLGMDGGFVPKPMPMSRLVLPPGKRADVILDATTMDGKKLALKSFASEFPNGIYGATDPSHTQVGIIPGYHENPLNGRDFVVLDIYVTKPTQDPVTGIPQQLPAPAMIDTANMARSRMLLFSARSMSPFSMLNGPFKFNDAYFDMMYINDTAHLGDHEIWDLRNLTSIAHPFHLHGLQFNIMTRDGNPPPPHEKGNHDVVLVQPQEIVRIAVAWKNFSDMHMPYMYHCHMLTHEDGGMMGQILIMDHTGLETDENMKSGIHVYPNPANQSMHIESEHEPMEQISLLDMAGREILHSPNSLQSKLFTLSTNDAVNGIYILRIRQGSHVFMSKIAIKH